VTADELVSLLDDLCVGLTVRDLMSGADLHSVSGLDDANLAILVRFLAGERPSGTPEPKYGLRAVDGEIDPYPLPRGPVSTGQPEGPTVASYFGETEGDIRLL